MIDDDYLSKTALFYNQKTIEFVREILPNSTLM